MRTAHRPEQTLEWSLAYAPAAQAANALRTAVADEDARARLNRLPPYADSVPPALVAMTASRAAEVVEHLDGRELHRVLFGSFRQLPWAWLEQLACSLSRECVTALIESMTPGIDAPRAAARLLAARAFGRPGSPDDGIGALSAMSAARMLGLLDLSALALVLRGTRGSAAGAPWLRAVEAAAMPNEVIRLRTALQADATSPAPGALEPSPLTIPGIVHRLEQTGLQAALDEFGRQSDAWQRAVLEALSARYAALLVTAMADQDPGRAGLLLGALTEWAVQERGEQRARVLYRARAAAVLDAAPTPVAARLLALLPDEVAREVRGRRRRGRLPNAAAYPARRWMGASPERTPLRPGVVLERLDTAVEGPGGPQPLRVDLVELDLDIVSVAVCRSAEPLSFRRLADRVGRAARGGTRPQEDLFRSLGLVRLAEATQAAGAVAGLNGNFYLDYGHYLDALDLGLDLVGEPNVRLGDSIGWFVSGGHELAPPVVNRATLIVTEDGDVHVRRVFARAVRIRGCELSWQQVDVAGPGTRLYTRLSGTHTPELTGIVDVSISGAQVVAVRAGGGSRVPLLGFVLAVPASEAGHFGGIAAGDPVEVLPDLPGDIGPVSQAMACGPLLVRDGQVDLDFALEGFGDKDAGVLPLSLTRAVDSFRAARSFVLLRGGRLVFGAVSGTQVGLGAVTVSAGVTFGELAALCTDLGADFAMGLDGGGSSSLVVADDDTARVLSVPTGGADVPPGAERFIATYLLAMPRQG